MDEDRSVSKWFGSNLAEILSNKIKQIYEEFETEKYINIIEKNSKDLNYTKRIELHAKYLRFFLPNSYKKAIKILVDILGEENPNETGMFKFYYWILPISKFIELYGLDDFKSSIYAIEEITKRSTGEYAIRPFIKKYPKETIKIIKKWSKSKNFHLRRLASEGLRPKLPWATKLDIYIDNPNPVFNILKKLMEDNVRFVQKSVANNIADYIKVNKEYALKFIKKYEKSDNKNTQWIIKHAMRNLKKK